jgi:S-adenosylmethionine decarboxylase
LLGRAFMFDFAVEGESMEDKKNDFVGRHLIIDASTFSKRNLTSTENVYSLFESLARNLDMTLVIPPIVCRFPFANDELSVFADSIQRELGGKLELNAVNAMNEFLRKRKMEESGVSGISIWAESHAAIHTWDADNYFAFDAFSCKEFEPKDAIRLLLNVFDIEMLNCINMQRFQRSVPKVSSFTVNDKWDVIVDGKKVGELDALSLNALPV